MGEIIMVGSIASVEERFGFLWGKDKEDGYTKEEDEALQIWEELRTAILDKGNANIEKTVEMLAQFTVYMSKPNTMIEYRTRRK